MLGQAVGSGFDRGVDEIVAKMLGGDLLIGDRGSLLYVGSHTYGGTIHNNLVLSNQLRSDVGIGDGIRRLGRTAYDKSCYA